MFDEMIIKSYKGLYSVYFKKDVFVILNSNVPHNAHFIIDKKVANIYEKDLSNVLDAKSVLLIDALESNKTLDKFTDYIEHLVSQNIRRNEVLIAIGGGIIQDITCFLASTLLRGVKWFFYPTTLLAQADSCIGSKSSINVGEIKNILGTFNPPEKIYIDSYILKTLEEKEIRSGIGEMLKVHGIEGPESFKKIMNDFHGLSNDFSLMEKYIHRSLEIKKKLIEIDEFDEGPRNLMNYGHSFGHAIESATEFGIPHGIAVSIGIDMAMFISYKYKRVSKEFYIKNRNVLRQNYKDYEKFNIPLDKFLKAISRDKKNQDGKLKLILPSKNGHVESCFINNDKVFSDYCKEYLKTEIIN